MLTCMVRKRITLKDIAAKHSLSVSVVSRVLSGQAADYGISAKTAKAVQATAKKLNYQPNQLARSLRMAKTNTLGLVIPDVSNMFFAGLARSISSAAGAAGYSVILYDAQECEAIESQAVETLLNRMIDGIIISPVGKSPAHILNIDKEHCPVVLLDRYFPGTDIPFVTSDNYGGALKATRYLLENGHRSIGFIQGLPETQPSVERLRGYSAALREYGIRSRKDNIIGYDFSRNNGYESTLAFLKRKVPPTALFLVSNQVALGALDALAERNLRIPEDISIIVFDDRPYFTHLKAPLTAVKQNVADLGKHAMELLQKSIDGQSHNDIQGITVPTKLVIRQSVTGFEERPQSPKACRKK